MTSDGAGATEGTGDPVLEPAVAPLSDRRRRLAMTAIVMTILMANLDASIVNVALPRLSQALHATPQATVWVTTASLLTTACAVPAVAALGDQVGRRRLFLVGVPLFTLASAGCALSPSLPVLLACRVTEALGTSAIFAVAIPVLRHLFPPSRLGSILGVNAMMTAIGVSAGPTLGGLVLAWLDWPWLFVLNVPLGLTAFALGLYAIPSRASERGQYDAAGAVWAAVAIASFMLGLHQLVQVSTLWQAGVLLGVCAFAVAAFLRRERAAARPVIPLFIWNGVFSLSVVTAFWSFFGQGVAFVALPFLFQSAYGATPLRSALLFTPWPAVIMVVAPFAGRLADRARPATLVTVGLGIYVAGLLWIALLGDAPRTWVIMTATGLAGLGFAFFQSPNNREMQGAVPLVHAASGAAVLNLNRSIAQSTGSGAVSMALILTGATSGSLLAQARAATSVLWVAVLGAALSLVLSAAKLRTVLRAERA